VLQLAVDWPLISSVGGFHALFDQSSMAAYNLRVEQVGQLHRDGFTAESALIGALGYLLFMGNASVFTGALLWRNNMRWLAILPLLFNGIYSLLSFQRSSFIAALLIQAFATIGMMKLNVEFTARAAPKPHRRPRPLLVAGLLTSGFAVLLIPIQLRNANTQNATGVQSIAQYLFSSIAGLNARTDAVTGAVVPPLDALGLPGAVPGFGAYTFTNLFGLFQRFGLPVATPPFTYDYDQVVILGRSFSTNTATSFYELILDAGWFGLIIGCLVVGIACTRWQMQMSSQTRIVLLPWVSLLLSVVAWSFFVNLFTRDARYMLVAAFGSLVLSGLFHYRRPSLAVENRTGRPFGERESHGQASKTPRSA
jgi:oligosaccharide repeat unit polymerase